MTICFFGIYNPTYSRSRILMEGFRAQGWKIVECHADPRHFRGLIKYIELWRQWKHIRYETFDLVLVAYPGQTIVPFARLLFGKKIIFDAFLSLYDSNVFDRKIYTKYSISAVLDWLRDWMSCTLAEVVLLDTEQHIHYFAHTFGISPAKCIRVWVGSDLQIAQQTTHHQTFTVHFHGTYIPLHGISFIIESAQLLKDMPIQFRLVGRGQEYIRLYKEVKDHSIKNIVFDEPVSSRDLPRVLESADICLGIFGDTQKAQRVIPNKVYEYMAAGKPIITADSPAIHELEIYGSLPFILVPAANAPALAAAIRSLYEDRKKREQLGQETQLFFTTHFTPTILVKELCKQLPNSVWRCDREQLYLHHQK